MKPVRQDEFGDTGNCLSACVASILEMELADVPNFLKGPENWYINFAYWLRDQGLKPRIHHNVSDPPTGYSIAGGTACRGWLHACVALDGIIVHDPHPDNTGLIEIDHYYKLNRTEDMK